MRSPARGQSRPSLPPQLPDSSEPPRDRPEKPHHLQVRGPRPPLGGNKSLTSPFVKQKAASATPLPGLGKVQPRPRWRRFALSRADASRAQTPVVCFAATTDHFQESCVYMQQCPGQAAYFLEKTLHQFGITPIFLACSHSTAA